MKILTFVLFNLCIITTTQAKCEKGIASWYGKENKKSCTGKLLSKNNPALAHKQLPIGTYVKVTCLRTNRSVIAIVEDRGPYTKGRIVDLNYIAAKQLGMIKTGITSVALEVIAK